MTRIKFCGFTREEDVAVAVALDVHAIGFVLQPGSPRRLDPDSVRRLARLAGPFVTTISVYGRFPAISRVETGYVQASEFGGEPSVPYIHAWRFGPEGMIMVEHSGIPAAILLDAYSENEYGGTGKRVDWELAATIVEKHGWPVILAGGLTPDNVAEAIRIVRPYAVDVSSGIESSPGIKDHGKMKAFVEAVRSAG